ncbi:hypothetical protein M2092_002363, partial [Fusobacterium sp. PH5-44]
KPIYPSTQIFFTYNYENGGRGKDNTKSEWANTLEYIAHKAGGGQVPKGKNPYSAGELLGGYTASLQTVPDDELDPDINGNMDTFTSTVGTSEALGLLTNGNGVYIDEPAWISSIELGANIKPLNPDLPVINKNVSISVGTPTLAGIPNPSVPAIAAPTAPSTVVVPTISVTAPSSVAQITINAPTMPSPSVPGEKDIVAPTVTLPSTVDPTMFSAPEKPVIIPPSLPSMPSIPTATGGANPTTTYYWWDGNDGVISQISLESGTYNIGGGANAYVVDITGPHSASAYIGTTPLNTFPTTTGVQPTVSRRFFHTLLNVGYSHYSSNVVINFNVNNAQIIDNETEGTVSGNLTTHAANGYIAASEVTRYHGYQSEVGVQGSDNGATELLFMNKGTVNINGNNSSYFYVTTHSNGPFRTNYIDNTGIINANGDGSLIISHTPDTSLKTAHIYVNSGTGTNGMYANGKNAKIMAWSYMQDYAPAAFVNDGVAKLQGSGTYGLIFSSQHTTHAESNAYIKVPIVITGDGATGVVFQNSTVTNTRNLVKFDIGKEIQTSYGNDLALTWTSDPTRIADGDLVEQSIGLYHDTIGTATVTAAEVELGQYADTSVGIYVASGKINIIQNQHETTPTQSQITISGGTDNIGILAKGGDIDYQGDINIDGGSIAGEGHKAAVVQGATTINLFGTVSVGTSSSLAANTTPIYADAGGTINVYATGSIGTPTNGGDGVKIFASGESIGAFATSTGTVSTINMNRNISPVVPAPISGPVPQPTISPDIYVEGIPATGGNPAKGVGIFASTNGHINSQNTYVKVKNGTTAVAAIGTNAKLDLTGSIIDYDGAGYAVYSDGIGTIDLSNGEIVLRGNGVAVEATIGGTSPITLSGARITMMSNDATAAILKVAGGGTLNLTTTNLVSDVASALGTVTILDGTDGTNTYSNYKIAAADGGNMVIDGDISKSDGAGTNGYMYFRRFLGQRQNLTVNNGVTVTAKLSSAQASDFKNQVIATEMNSSANAVSRNEAQINNNGTIIAARTDNGNGAVGALINYGTVTNSGIIEIQKDFTGIKGGTGIFATNGSYVNNTASGNINTYGEEGLGIYATAWREISGGGYAGAEFGASALGQGLTKVENYGNITTTGKSSVGIYMDNNSDLAGSLVAISGENMTGGTINVGEDSIAMYARGNGVVADTKIGNFGTLVIGKNGAGMYGENALTITNIGDLSLGEGAIGVVLDPASTINVGGIVGTITASASGDKAVIAINGSKTLTPLPTTISLPTSTINLSGTTGVTGLYVQGATGATNKSGDLNLGTNGVGIYVNNGEASNAGTINMTAGKTSAVGMFSAKGEVNNAAGAIINVGDATQTGMAACGSGAEAVNNGTINMNVTGATGIYVNNGATITDNAAGSLGFNATKTFGIVSDNGIVKLAGGPALTLANSNESIYVYAKNNSTVNINGPLTVDGVADAGNQKSVGIYLDGTNTLNNGNILTAQHAAIGIYANGANTLNGGTYAADGDKSVGVYFTNGGTLSNAIVEAGNGTTDSALGVYAAAGTVTVSGGLNIDLQNGVGTGIYLSNGASMAGDTITITNANATNSNIGIYYNGTSGTATHGTDIILSGAQRLVGIYANGGISVTNNKNITDTTVHDSVAVLVGGGSTYTGSGTLTGAAGGDIIGYYVNDGTVINSGTIDLTGTGTNSVGMVAEPGAGKTAIVKNAGTITADTSVGLLMAGMSGTAKGENTGTITVAATGTGVYLEGSGSSFDGTGGTISPTGTAGTTAVGITLNGTGAGQVVDAGTLNLGTDSVGVYASNNSLVDFPLALTGTNGTGVFVQGGSTISGNVDGSQGTDVVSVFLDDATAIVNNAQISTGQVGATTSVGLYLGGTGQTYNLTSGTITANNSGTVGINVATGNTLSYGTGITTNVGSGAIGIYGTGAGTVIDTQGGTLNIDGAGIGIFVQSGAVANVGSTGALNVNFTGTGGVLTFNDGGTINLGTQINILSGSGTLAATTNGNLSNSGTINIGNGSVGLLGIYNAAGTYAITNTPTGIINVTDGGVGLAATGTVATVTVENQGQINVDGSSSVGMYSNIGGVDNSSGTMTVTNGGIGIYVDGNGSIVDLGTMDVTGGVGYVIDGITLAAAPTGNLTLHTGTATDYSIAGYYLNTNGNIVLPTVTQADYSIIAAINGGTNTVGNVSTGSASGKNQIGIYASNSNTTIGSVTVDGDENVGVFGENGTVTTGAITVGGTTPSTYISDMSTASVGAYMKDGTLSVASLDVKDNGIGAYGEKSDITTGAIQVGATGVGAYAKGTGVETLTVASLDIGSGSLGAYGKDTNVVVAGNMDIANGTAVGIISEGNGDVNFSGIATIAGKGSSTASIGIYKKDGQGTITSSGTFNVGDGGYAIYADNAGSSSTTTVNNNANVTLGTSSVGIYAGGQVVANNSGNIVVGATDLGGDTTTDHSDLSKHLNSLAMYGEKGAQLTNSGTITVANEHSLGAYIKESGTQFTNTGIINVDNGATGILATNFSTVVNSGTINLGNTTAVCGALNVGVGIYGGTQFTNTNTGVINVGSGVGVYIGDATIFNNQGTINIDNGVGTSGDGVLNNTGTIVLKDLDGSGGTSGGLKGISDEGGLNNQGAITITPNGDIIINNQYIHSGSFVADGHVVVDNAVINITAGTGTIAVGSIEGNFVLDSSFLTTGNGYGWSVKDFLQTAQGAGITGSDLTVSGSPLYYATITAGSLEVAKQPYAYIVTGTQFDNLYNGLDSLLAQDQEGTGNDSQVLKNLNAYLDNIYNTQGEEAFSSEASRTLAETRGDVYSTMQQRLSHVQGAFDSAFNELVSSHNFTKDTGKYSVIYQQGSYEDKTLGVDDYDYRVQGLLYMQEYESRNYGNKWGYSLGFAVSRFDFDDAPTYGDKSKEDVYSLRAGLHNVHSFDEDDTWSLRTRLELGYNRHETERTIELDKVYKNEGKYNSYNVSFDNRLAKTLYRSDRSELKIYGDLNMEYGQIDGFTEKSKGDSGLELKLKDRDYYSIEGAVGIQASTRAYLGKKISAKLTGDLSYGYDFGNSHDKRVKAKVAGGTEGWYNLIRPEEEKGKIKGNVGLTFEKADNYGVTFDVEVRKQDNKKSADVRYGVKFNYKF